MAASPPLSPNVSIHDETTSADTEMEPLAPCDPEDPDKPSHFDYITQNIYISSSLHVSKDRKRAKRMVCECQFDPEMDDSEDACGENCLNRLLMIECGSRCPCGEYCTNKRFQKAEYSNVDVFKTDNKGWGLKAFKEIAPGDFVMEYCGEVCTPSDFEQRKLEYVKEKRRHYYFMSLKTDEILDATRQGNLSRYINHSCDPNCETQKWTVNGRLRIGFFSVKRVQVDEELTFDYKFQRFGDQAQKCYCGSANCRGYIGQSKQSSNSLKVFTPSRRDLGSPRSPRERRRGRQRLMSDADNAFEKEVYSIVGSSWRLKDSVGVLALSRIMLQAETPSQRIMLLQVLQATEDSSCLKKFLSLHGLRLLWSWMVDSGDRDTEDVIQFRVQTLQVLDHLPLTTRNQLEENKLLPVVRKWRERSNAKHSSSKLERYAAKDKALSSPSHTEDQLEGTIVTEADSVLCEGVASEGSEVTGDAIKVEDGSCEAEAVQLSGSSDQSQDEGTEGGERDMLATLAVKLVDKWEGLKEVFRIPKRTPQAKRSSAEPEDSSNEGGQTDGDLLDESPLPPRKRTKTRQGLSPELTWSRRSKGLLTTPRHSTRSSKLSRESSTSYNPSTPPQPHTPPTYSPGFSATTPLQNTLIVQHPGHSVYVQQQVFKDGCQTTILPASYLQPPTTRPQYVQVQQSPGLLLPHTPGSQPSPQVTAYTHQPQLLTQQTGVLQQYPNYVQPSSNVQNMPGSGVTSVQTFGVQGCGLAQPGTPQQYVQFSTNTQQVYLPAQTVSSQPKPLFDVPLSTSSLLQTPALNLAPLPPPPPEEESQNLPPNWKIAHDASGKVYYYHAITRKTQWERPTDQDAEGTITMDLGTPEPESDSEQDETSDHLRGPCTPTEDRQPHTPEGTPPLTPTHSTTGPQTPPTSTPHTPLNSTPPTSTPHTPLTTPHTPLASTPHTPHTSTPQELHTPSEYNTTLETSLISVYEPVDSENVVNETSGCRTPESLYNVARSESGTPEPHYQSSPERLSSSDPSTPHSNHHHPHTPTQSPPVTVSQSPSPSMAIIVPKRKGQKSPHKRRRKKEGKVRSKEYILKEAFCHKLSKVVTHCLDQHRKPDCKYGRITCVEDFKYLARKLSHGLTEKEITRKGSLENLEITDSVKAKAKDYIRQYMKRFGSIYVRTRSP